MIFSKKILIISLIVIVVAVLAFFIFFREKPDESIEASAQDAVLVRSGRKLAFVVEEGLAKWRYIDVGLENEDYAEVLDGVKEGESVIIEGHFTLAHDARVRIQK